MDEFIEVEMSSTRHQQARKIDTLLQTLKAGDKLLVAELSRLGRNMLEFLTLINRLSESQVEVVFVR